MSDALREADRTNALAWTAAVMFVMTAIGFSISMAVHLAGDPDLPQNRLANVLLYAGAALPFMAIGAFAALFARRATWMRWLALFDLLFVGWAVMTLITIFRMGQEVPDAGITAFLHMIAGWASAFPIFIVRRVATQRH